MTQTDPLRLPASGLYAVTTDAGVSLHRLVADVDAAITGGAKVIQYRRKKADADTRRAEAKALKTLCDTRRVPLLINDDVELALAVRAGGVHVGRNDADFRTLRGVLGANAIIGVSCYASIDLAVEAQARGASYVAFGRFFPSQSKPGATPCAISVLTRARAQLTVPIVAIGGITPENASTLIAAGADLLAVISGIFEQDEPAAAARRYAELFDSGGGRGHR